ncbi:hypothetical protein HKX48_005310 [Thoreauomyces humboldtii]|nr:hypothetical protein HKX48_005310 [Thoreauomyces humboldtii]
MTSQDESKLWQRPRPYQLELLKHALARNTIAYLDTGSGKTLVSVLLMQERATDLVPVSKADLVRKPRDTTAVGEARPVEGTASGLEPVEPSKDAIEYAPGVLLPRLPKKIVFLVPTVPLVLQQSAKIRENTDLVVGEYCRDETASVSRWQTLEWYYEMSTRQVLVLTPQILLNMARHGFVNLARDVSLIIVDECHHAIKSHPYNLLFKEFYHTIVDREERPKVFGMTASPIYQRVNTRDESLLRLQELQQNLDCTVITVADRSSLTPYVPVASETLVEYAEPPVRPGYAAFGAGVDLTPSMHYYAYWMTELEKLLSDISKDGKLPDEVADGLRRSRGQIIEMERELGYWLAGKATEDAVRGCKVFNPAHQRFIQPDDPHPKAPPAPLITQRDVTPKVLVLLRLIEERAQTDAAGEDGSKYRGMIFVERRLSAKVLSELLNVVAPERFPVVKCSFVTGRAGVKSTNQQRRAFDTFRTGQVNTLVVTRVAEEGVDIPACRLIVVFNIFRSHTGYVQSRGRARDLAGSEYLIMVERNHIGALRTVAQAKVAEVMTRNVAEELAEGGGPVGDESTRVLRSEFDNDTTEVLLGALDTPLTSKAGASVPASGASQVLMRYSSSFPLSHGTHHTGYTLEFDYMSGDLDQWRACLTRHLQAMDLPASADDKDLSRDPYGYVYSYTFPAWTPLAGEVVHGWIRATRKLAQKSAALAACKRLYESGALDEHLLPNDRFKKRDLKRALGRVAGGRSATSKQIIDPADLEVQEYRRSVPTVFQDSLVTEDGSLPQNPTARNVYVTVLLFGPSWELYSRGRLDDPYQAIHGAGPEYRRTVAIVTKTPLPSDVIPSFALWLPNLQSCAVQVRNWHFENMTGSAIGKRRSHGDTEQEDDEEPVPFTETASQMHPVSFTEEQYKSLAKFQSVFWDLALKGETRERGRPGTLGKRKREDNDDPSKPEGTNTKTQATKVEDSKDVVSGAENGDCLPTAHTRLDSASDAKPDAHRECQVPFFMVLPMYGHVTPAERSTSDESDPSKFVELDSDCSWHPDWDLMRKVAEKESCLLYDWIVGLEASRGQPVPRADLMEVDRPDFNDRPAFDITFDTLRHFKAPLPVDNSDPDQTTAYSPEVLREIDELLEQTVVATLHNKNIYSPTQLDITKRPTDALEKLDGRVITYAENATKVGSYKVTHPGSAMVLVRPLSVLPNMTKPTRILHAAHAHKRRNNGRNMMLVPDACSIMPYTIETHRLAIALPSVMHKLVFYCNLEQFRRSLELPYVRLQTLFTAFSAPSAKEHTDYETLETLGDSFLKYAVSTDIYDRYPEADEGELSDRRARAVSNLSLYKKAKAFGLPAWVNVAPFNPKVWKPPGYCAPAVVPDVEGTEDLVKNGTTRGSQAMSLKTVADFLESLVGAYYTDAGNDVALELLKKFELISCQPFPRLRVVKPDLLTGTADARSSLHELETILQYRFHDIALLQQAFALGGSAGTTIGPSQSYQRLEFLGDAILDWAVTRFFYNSYPQATPQDLTELRQAAVNNEALARLTVKLGLQKYLQHASLELAAEIDRYVAFVSTVDAAADPQLAAMSGNKVLGDLFEAVAGAVYVDSGYDVEVMWRVVRPVMSGYMGMHATLDGVSKSPIRMVTEHFQGKGFLISDLEFRHTHLATYHYQCDIRLMDEVVASGKANSKQLAKRLASSECMKWAAMSSRRIEELLTQSRASRGRATTSNDT